MAKIRLYQKKEPFRSATLFVIICEGGKREPEYFEFFNGISSRIKVKPVPSEDGKSAPNHLLVKAEDESKRNDFGKSDEIWFVIDTDRWRDHIHNLRDACSKQTNWSVAQSNPCFEVWLYFHFSKRIPSDTNLTQGGFWKSLVPKVVDGGFSSEVHPMKIETAIINSESVYKETGYIPDVGSTQLFQLGKRILPFIQKDLKIIFEISESKL
jgi:hypothetical protein